jgi:hypothetical protein
LSIRGDGYDPYHGMPPVSVITEDQFRQNILQEPKSVNPWDRALTLLHFDSGDSSTYVDDLVANVLAYYSWSTKSVTIVSHPSQTGKDAESEAMITLAHEFVHSLQDQELDLQNSSIETSDGSLAYNTLVEGDARFYELLFMSDVQNLGFSQSNIVDVTERILANTYAYVDQYGSSLFAAQALTYALGSNYEAIEYKSGGNAAIRHGYAKEPKRTLGFMGGTPPDASPCPAPEASLAPGSIDSSDEFGALLFYTFMRGWGVSHLPALAAAQSWVGDSVRLQATSDLATTAVAWRIELSTPPASDIVAALSSSGELTVDVSGNRLLITVSDATLPVTWAPVAGCP